MAHVSEMRRPETGSRRSGVVPGKSRLLTLFQHPAAIIAALVALNIICFYRSLKGYFLADDFVHVTYLFNVFNGHGELLIKNFFGNWMEAQGTQFYRPLISLTLALDYLVGKGPQSTVFHASNLIYQIASTIFLFLACRRLGGAPKSTQATLTAFFAGALFAVNPLHPEVVSWIIGRVDSVCLAFYLASFWLFLKATQDRSRWALAFSLGAGVLALLSKEMAVTLPAVLVCQCLFFNNEGGLKATALRAVRLTAPFWALIGAYLGWRTAVLGTFSGGYGGSIGEGFAGSFWQRWVQEPYFLRVAFPFNAEVFSDKDKLRKILAFTYAAIGAIFALRLVRERGAWKLPVFSLVWFAIVMIPTYQVWNLTESLQCSRFIYFGTAALSLMLASMAVPAMNAVIPTLQMRPADSRQTRVLITLGCAALAVLTVVYAAVVTKNNVPWVHAGSEVRALKEAIETEFQKLPAGSNIALLNVPHRKQGAHMIYNGAMLSVLLSPPLSKEDYSKRVYSFEPDTYGEDDLINADRLRRLLAEDKALPVYFWNRQEQKLTPLSLRSHAGEDAALAAMSSIAPQAVPKTAQTVRFSSPHFSVGALDVDFIRVTISATPKTGTTAKAMLLLTWTGKNVPIADALYSLSQQIVADGTPHTYTFAVSEHKKWLYTQRIHGLSIEVPLFAAPDVQPDSIRLISCELSTAASKSPRLEPSPDTLAAGVQGSYYPIGDKLRFNFDASEIQGAASAIAEVSPPDSWFEHYTGTTRDAARSQRATEIKLTSTKGSFSIPLTHFSRPGYYQIRVFGLDKSSNTVGLSSTPVNLQIGRLASTPSKP